MDREYGRGLITIAISVSGIRARLTGTEFTLGQMETGTKANGTYVSNMEQAQIPLQAEIHTQASTKMENLMAKDSSLGAQVNSTSETSGTD